MSKNNQSSLLSIVQTWDIKEIPEYRGFRCACCQQYKNQAWHHYLNSGGFICPAHLCDDRCQRMFEQNQIRIDPAKKKIINISSFDKKYTFTKETKQIFEELNKQFPFGQKPKLIPFFCDLCKKYLTINTDGQRKGFHIWYKTKDNNLVELHFHQHCAEKLGIK